MFPNECHNFQILIKICKYQQYVQKAQLFSQKEGFSYLSHFSATIIKRDGGFAVFWSVFSYTCAVFIFFGRGLHNLFPILNNWNTHIPLTL